MMEETLLMFVFSFSISFIDTIGARDLSCLSSCLLKKNTSVRVTILNLSNPGNLLFNAIVWFSSKPMTPLIRFLIQEVEAAL